MDKLIPIPKKSLESSTPGIKYTPRESAKTKRGKGIDQDSSENYYALNNTNIIEVIDLDCLSPEDERDYSSIPSLSNGSHVITDIEKPENALENISCKSIDPRKNKKDEIICKGTYSKKSINIKIKNKKHDVIGIGCDPYNIEENTDLIEFDKEFEISVDKQEKKVVSETTECLPLISNVSNSVDKKEKKVPSETAKCVSQISNIRSLKEYDKNINIENCVNEKKDNKTFWANDKTKQVVSSDTADELLKGIVFFCKYPENSTNEINVLREDSLKVCPVCGFESNSVKERIEHLDGEIHKSGLKTYTSSQVHGISHICPLCGFNSKTVLEQKEHLNGSRHKGAQEARIAIIYGILVNYTKNTFYCTVCSWFVTDFQPMIEHILSSKHRNSVLVNQHRKHGIRIKTDLKGDVYCNFCNCLLKSGSDIHEINNHLKNHIEVCWYFNFDQLGCNYYNLIKICKSRHECGICCEEHPQIKCALYKDRKCNDQVNEKDELLSGNLKANLKGIPIFHVSGKTENRENLYKENSHDSSLPCTYSYRSTKDHASKFPLTQNSLIDSKQRSISNSNETILEHSSKSPITKPASIINKQIQILNTNETLKEHVSLSSLTQLPLTNNKQKVIQNSNETVKEHPSNILLTQPILTDNKQARLFNTNTTLKEHVSINPLSQPSFNENNQMKIQNLNETIKENPFNIVLTQSSFTENKQTNISNTNEITTEYVPNTPMTQPFFNENNQKRIQNLNDSIKEHSFNIILKQPSFTDDKQARISDTNEMLKEDVSKSQLTQPSFNDANQKRFPNLNETLKEYASKSPLTQYFSDLFTDSKRKRISNSNEPVKEKESKSHSTQSFSKDNKQKRISKSNETLNEKLSESPQTQHVLTDNKRRRVSKSSLSFSDDGFHDGDEELNLITTIVKLLEICDNRLGNLGYFFAVTLNKVLEIKESTEGILNILREPANIILMEVIFKKIKTLEKSSDDRNKKVMNGIRYLEYLISVSKSSELCNSSQNIDFISDSSPTLTVGSSTNNVIVANSSSVPSEIFPLILPSPSSNNSILCHGLDVEEIAKVTFGKNAEYIINFIKRILKLNGKTLTQEAVREISLALSKEHFKMLTKR